ncbi:ABC transporter permease [Pseudoduganella sp. GCM10020061]|uniref:ABC transporter permease n=1 Tax=Pseudoduganella sp. GCM10020061 TaxID=3317345 RepID=UPI003637AA3C
MFRHLLTLTWKRKSRNLMLSLEILLAFAVVFAVAAASLVALRLYQVPIGFAHQDVWAVDINSGSRDLNHHPELYDRFKRAAEELPEVEKAAFSTSTPFTMSSWTSQVKSPASGAQVLTDLITVSDDFFEVAGMTLAGGRWFSDIDNGAAVVPVIINRTLARELFRDGPAVGKEFERGDSKFKVAGVVEQYRGRGELSLPASYVIMRSTPGKDQFGLNTLMIRLKPGTARAFETRLQRKLMQVRNDWGYKISPLADLRSTMLKGVLSPLAVLAVVAAFMLVMVAFGLFGVLWQNTTRRIPEIGLRRAIGATATGIYRQVVAEQMLLSTIAMLVGLVLLVQLPLTGALSVVLDWNVFIAAAAVSMLVIYLISLLCALYPGWRASRLSPTEALHYE